MEKAVIFGPEKNLSGILTLPSAGRPGPAGLPGLLLLNAGLIHHVGPYRMSVDLARGLASAGFASLRFDFSGIGDSPMGKTILTDRERGIIECQAAMDALSAGCGCASFVLIGLCSGADNSHTLAASDPRVCGMVSIDGYAYRTLFYYLKDYGPALINPKKWVTRGIRLLKILFSVKTAAIEGVAAPGNGPKTYKREFPPQRKVMKEIQGFIDRGVKAFYIYSGGGAPECYNYEKQFFRMYKAISFKGRVRHRYYKNADHTFTDYSLRVELLNEIKQWVKENFSGREPPPSGSSPMESEKIYGK